MRKFFITSIIFNLFTLILCVSAYASGNKKIFIEADSLTTKENSFLLRGHAIVKSQDLLVNGGEIKVIKKIKEAKQNQEKNSKMIKADVNDEDDNKYSFYVNYWMKLRTHDDNIIYGKSMFNDDEKKFTLIKNAQIFPSGKRDHVEVYSSEIKRNDCIYTLKDVSVCPCKLFTDKNVEKNRETSFFEISDNDELLNKPSGKNSIENTDKEMHDKLKYTLLSVKADKIIYNIDEKKMTFEKMKWRVFGIPFFYWPRYTLHTDNKGDTGFLLPQIILSGSRQTGFELPFFWKIKSNMDLLLSRVQYFDFGYKALIKNTGDVANMLKNPDHRMRLKDLSNYRESFTRLRFRHLLSTKYAYESFYLFDGLITDWTQLMDEETGTGATKGNLADGKIVMGLRWIASFKARLKLTKTTFIHIDQYYASDRNMAFFYLRDPRQTRVNTFHLFDVDYNRYISAEVYSYQSGLLPINKKTIPMLFPVIRADFDFKKDKFGGNFYIKSKAYYLHRDEGYRTATVGVDGGYHLPYILKNGTKIIADTMVRLQYNHIDFHNLSDVAYLPYQYTLDARTYFFGNLGGLINSGYYSNNNFSNKYQNGLNHFAILNFNKIQAEHPILITSPIGSTIITPKIAVRFMPNNGRNIYVPVEDNLNMNINYYNAFELMQSSGFGIYDTGGSFVYGINMKHRFKKDIEIESGIAQNIRMRNDVADHILAEFTGFRRTFSDMMFNFGFKYLSLSGNGYFNYDIYNHEMRMLIINLMYSIKYISISVGYNSFSKRATIFNTALEMITASLILKPIKSLRITGTINYSFSGTQGQYMYIKPGFVSYTIGLDWKISCFTIGFRVSENKIRLSNVPSTVIYRFTFAFNGFG